MQLGVSTCDTLKNVEIGPVSLDTFLIVTDGACEGDSSRVGSVGGVLVDPSGCCCQHLSPEVPVDFMRRALACSANPIYELETVTDLHSPLCLGSNAKVHPLGMLPGQRCSKSGVVQSVWQH